jgi:murein DD-endopeptidase MepM/ murein hydrolase activator NlpD
MGPKHHTVIFVPHARARPRKLRVSNRQLWAGGIALLLLLAGSVFTSWTFLTNEIDRQQLARVTRENADLKAINEGFATSVASLEEQLGGFELQTRQLAIVAGLDAVSPAAGVGGQELPAGDALDGLAVRARGLQDRLADVEHGFEARERWMAATPSIAPARGVLTSGFGTRRDPFTGQRARHEAIDISTAPGQAVQATADGIVLQAGADGSLGVAVSISHGYGVTTRYGHLQRVAVRPGQQVRRGEVVGFVGNTGRSTGYHVHYEVLDHGVSVDPLAYILDGTQPAS